MVSTVASQQEGCGPWTGTFFCLFFVCLCWFNITDLSFPWVAVVVGGSLGVGANFIASI